MGKVLLCMGKHAGRPFFMEKVYVNLYSVEELCYCLIRDVYLIDQELLKSGLPDWLAQECELYELSDRLKGMLKKGCSLGEYAGEILDYVGYGSLKERLRTREVLEQGADFSTYEKRKARADYLSENKKYVPAIKNYDSLLEELPEDESALRARVLHNRGVAYAGLFLFTNAAESFRQAFECGRRTEDYVNYLVAKRIQMEETDYVNFAAGLGDKYELALQVEKLMEDAVKDFEGTEESRMLFTLKVCKEENHSVSYDEEMERIVNGLKEHYREITAE